MARPSKRLALLLCLIVLHQDFINARSSYNEHLAMFSRDRISPHRLSREIMDEDDEFENTLSEVQARHNVSLSIPGRSLSRSKRFFGLFIFIVSLVITVIATVVETIYDIKGCCGLGFSFLCGFESDFNSRRDAVKSRAEAVDKKLEDVLKKRDDLECLAEVLKTLWGRVTDLVKLEEELLGTIDPTFKNIMLCKQKNITDSLQNIQSDLDQTDIDAIIEKLDEGKVALQLSISWAQVAVPGIAMIAGKAYKAYKVNKMYKALKATQLEPLLKASPKVKKLIGFTQGSAKLFLKSTAIAKFSSKASTLLKGMKFFKVAGAAMSILSIAMDLFSIISTFVACADKTSKAKEACSDLKEAENKLTEAEGKVDNLDNTIKTGLEAQLLKEVRDDNMHNALIHIKETIEGLPKGEKGRTDFDTARCSRIIPENLALFKSSSNWEDIKDGMLDIIDSCVDKLPFAYKCLKARNDIQRTIINKCRDGVKNFEELYTEEERDKKSTLDDCRSKGEPYTTKQMFKDALEKASQTRGIEFYTESCKMNDIMVVEEVCKGNGHQDLTDAQAQQLRSEKCENNKPPKLSSSAIQTICSYKIAMLDTDTIYVVMLPDFPNIKKADIDGVTDCPGA